MLISPTALAARSRSLEGATPEQILEFALEEYAPRIAISTAFGVEGCALIAMASQLGRPIKVFTVDTGYLFEEAVALRRSLQARYEFELTVFDPATTVKEAEAALGEPPWQRSTDACCAARKVEPTARALAGLDAWVAGLRRDQASSRRQIDILERYEHADASPLIKVHPLANWTRKDVWRYVVDNDVPYNPLLDQGYKSVGCRPCTKPVGVDGNERDGRWGGKKEECGIHTFLVPLGGVGSKSST